MGLSKTKSMLEQSTESLLTIYRNMLTARSVDKLEAQQVASGAAFFHVSGAGHEGTAALAQFLRPEDYLHLHYRDKALLLARGLAPRDFFDSLFCNAASHSAGRQMSAHLSDRSRNVLSIVGPVGNNALQAAGVAHTLLRNSPGSLVVCSMGEGTTQQGEVLEAIAEAARSQLPILFLIHDNGYAISTRTEKSTFFDTPNGEQAQFYSIPITRVDGTCVRASCTAFSEATQLIRGGAGPQIVLYRVERLDSHSNADDQNSYRSDKELERIRTACDPIEKLHQVLQGRVEAKNLEEEAQRAEQLVSKAASHSLGLPAPLPCFSAQRSLPDRFFSKVDEYRGSADSAELTMREAIHEVLKNRLSTDERICLYGEDIEDPKGDVFGVTKGLSTQFPGRVVNSPLSESTIVGLSAGRALAGERPIAFLQFADFLPLALNQITSEIATMFWRTKGKWQCPLVLMITCGGYRPGLGPFHAQSLEALALHTPGLDVLMPATAGDAAGLLNTALESDRPTLFFYPKSRLNNIEEKTSRDTSKHFVPLGTSRTVRSGEDITFVCWGNTVSLCVEAAMALEGVGLSADVLDLRSLSPWDKGRVLDSVNKTQTLIVAHEDNLTCGMGAEVVSHVAENVQEPVKLARVARPDTYIPCNFSNQLDVLPSASDLIKKVCELLDLSLSWQEPAPQQAGITTIEATGTSPADETVVVAQWRIAEGQKVVAGQPLADVEANKAATELLCRVEGVVVSLLAEEGATVKVGAPLLRVRTSTESSNGNPVASATSPVPLIQRRPLASMPIEATAPRHRQPPLLCSIKVCLGELEVANEELERFFTDKKACDIEQMTGVKTRRRRSKNQTLLSMATQAARKSLRSTGLGIEDLSAIVCSTGTPDIVTPSLACRVLSELTGERPHSIQAHDISAACSGYLYGLQSAFDILASKPNASVLVVTSEVLSPLLDSNDFSTAILFGDAATATVVTNRPNFKKGLELRRPELSASGESGRSLSVPVSPLHGHITMRGTRVFSQAVREMSSILEMACTTAGIHVQDLDLVVPHQANRRITDALAARNQIDPERIYSNIEKYGNTSSSTIPICLSEIMEDLSTGSQLGLCAFGGGFTFGAAILRVA